MIRFMNDYIQRYCCMIGRKAAVNNLHLNKSKGLLRGIESKGINIQ
jgi:hypothetical protein